MSLGTMVSRVLGYVRDAMLASLFSLTVTDAFIVAFRLPNLVRRLLGEGSLSVSFIPVFMEQLHNQNLSEEQRHERALKLASSIFTLLTLVTCSLSAAALVWMEPLLDLWVGDKRGFAAIPGKMELTVELARIMIFYVYLVTAYAFLMAVANSLHRFFLPAVATAFFNLTVIVFAVMPQEMMQPPGTLLGWGVVVGGVVQAGMVAVLLYREGMLPRLTWKIRSPGVKTILVNMGPGLIGLGIYQVMTIANTFFAARLPEGSQSYIYFSDRILELPQSVIAISLGTALLPTFSQLLAQSRREEMLSTATEAMKALLFLALPSAVGMAILARPIVEVLFMRGAFGADDVAATAGIIQIYSALLVVSSISKVTVPGFYAIKNTWMPALVAGVCLLVHLILASWLVERAGVLGLAGATAMSGALNMLILQVAFHFMIGKLNLSEILVAFLRLGPALGVMGLWAASAYPFGLSLVEPWLNPMGSRLFSLGLTIGGSMIIYFVVATWCGSIEARRTWAMIRRRLKLV